MKEVFGKMPVTSRDFPVILFDASGTIFHSNPSFEKVYQMAVGSVGISKSDSEMDHAMLKALRRFNDLSEASFEFELKPSLWPAVLLDCLDVARDEKILSEVQNILSTKTKVVVAQSTIDICSTLKDRGYRLALVSNWNGILSDVVRDHGLLDLFESVVTSSDVGFAKPRREIFDAALEDLDIAAEKAVMIGESFAADIVGSHRAQIARILYDPKFRQLRALSHEDTSGKVVSLDSFKHNRRLDDVRVITRFEELLEIFL